MYYKLMNRSRIVMEENTGDNQGGGSGYNTDDGPEDKKEVESTEPETDDLGYAKVSEEEPPNVQDQDKNEEDGEKDSKEKESEEPQDSPSGYGEDSDADGEKGKETSEDNGEGKEGDDGKDKEGEPDLGDTSNFLPEEIELIKAEKPEVQAALAEYKRKELAKMKEMADARQAENAKKVKEQRAGWVKELKEDPDFGGESFGSNVKKVDRVLNDFLPNVKKKLTESKGMLPPYIMRDLAKLSKNLYGTEGFVKGEEQQSKKEVKSEDQEIDEFYS